MIDTGLPNSIFVTKMAQTYDRIHMNHASNYVNVNGENKRSTPLQFTPRKINFT